MFLWKSSELWRLGHVYHLLSATRWCWKHRDRSVILPALVCVIPCLILDPVPAYTSWRRSLTVTQNSHLHWARGGIICMSCLARSRARIFQLGLASLCSPYLLEPGDPTDDTQGCLHCVANVLVASWGWFGWEHSHSHVLPWWVSLLFLHLCVSGSMWLLWGAWGFLCNQSCLLWDGLFVLQGREKRSWRSFPT